MVAEEQLRTLFQQEIAVLQKLDDFALAKKKALFTNDFASLDTIVLSEEALSKRLSALNAACSKQVQFFLRSKKNPSKLPEEFAEEINEIRQLSEKIRKTNKFNQIITKDSLSVVQFMLNSLLSLNGTDSGVYGSSGKMIGGNPKSTYHLDSKG